jgi:hypothetical protein
MAASRETPTNEGRAGARHEIRPARPEEVHRAASAAAPLETHVDEFEVDEAAEEERKLQAFLAESAGEVRLQGKKKRSFDEATPVATHELSPAKEDSCPAAAEPERKKRRAGGRSSLAARPSQGVVSPGTRFYNTTRQTYEILSKLDEKLKRKFANVSKADVLSLIDGATFNIPEKVDADELPGGPFQVLTFDEVMDNLNQAVQEKGYDFVPVVCGRIEMPMDTLKNIEYSVRALEGLFDFVAEDEEIHEELFDAMKHAEGYAKAMLDKLRRMPVLTPVVELYVNGCDPIPSKTMDLLEAHFPRDIGTEWTADEDSDLVGWKLNYTAPGKGTATTPEGHTIQLTVQEGYMAKDLLGPRYKAFKEHAKALAKLAKDCE